jgi:hypothetical protein
VSSNVVEETALSASDGQGVELMHMTKHAMIPIRLRLSSGQDLTVNGTLTEPLSVLAAASESTISSLLGPNSKASFSPPSSPSHQLLQFIFLGRRYTNADLAKITLQSVQGFNPDSSILQVLVLNRPDT